MSILLWKVFKHSFMKGTQGITADVNIYFINYKMIKTPLIKTNWSYSLNQNRFYWMNACHLPHLSLFRGCIILRRVGFFLIFSRNYQQGVTVVFVSTNEKRLQNQFYQRIKSKLMDTFGSGKSSLFERVDFSIYRFLSSFSKSK